MSLLDTLFAIRDSLEDDNVPFVIGQWHYCTCGHIYRGSTGDFAENGIAVSVGLEEHPDYYPVLDKIARLLGWDGNGGELPPVTAAAFFISAATINLAGQAMISPRKAALELIRQAIDAEVNRRFAEVPAAVHVELTEADVERSRNATEAERDGMVCT